MHIYLELSSTLCSRAYSLVIGLQSQAAQAICTSFGAIPKHNHKKRNKKCSPQIDS